MTEIDARKVLGWLHCWNTLSNPKSLDAANTLIGSAADALAQTLEERDGLRRARRTDFREFQDLTARCEALEKRIKEALEKEND